MKKCYSALRWPHVITGDVLNRRLLFKTNWQQVAIEEPSPIIFAFLGIGQKKLSMHKICGGAEKCC